jgi:hypothetical protein
MHGKGRGDVLRNVGSDDRRVYRGDVPLKFYSMGRRHIPRQKYRVSKWRDYDAALRNRGSLTVWFTASTRTSPSNRKSRRF